MYYAFQMARTSGGVRGRGRMGGASQNTTSSQVKNYQLFVEVDGFIRVALLGFTHFTLADLLRLHCRKNYVEFISAYIPIILFRQLLFL